MPAIAEIPRRKIFFSHFQWSNWEFHWRDLFCWIIIDRPYMAVEDCRNESELSEVCMWMMISMRHARLYGNFLTFIIYSCIERKKAELGHATMATSTGSNECCFPCLFPLFIFTCSSSSTCVYNDKQVLYKVHVGEDFSKLFLWENEKFCTAWSQSECGCKYGVVKTEKSQIKMKLIVVRLKLSEKNQIVNNFILTNFELVFRSTIAQIPICNFSFCL